MIFLIILLLSALFISSIAAWFSIAGLVAIFPGATLAVTLMGVALELGKLITASWLYRSWQKANVLMKTYFITAVITLSFITSIGIFGYLTKSHIEGSQGLETNSDQITLVDEQIAIERENIESQRKAQTQLDAAVNNLVANEKTTERAITIRNRQRNERNNIVKSISESNQKLVQLQQQKAELSKGQRELETEVGPIKYVAQMIYGGDDLQTIERAVRLLTLLLIFVFDPLAILLVVAANMQLKELKKDVPEVTKLVKEKVILPKQEKVTVTKKQGKKIVAKETPKESNITKMESDWSPGTWFKIVNKPK